MRDHLKAALLLLLLTLFGVSDILCQSSGLPDSIVTINKIYEYALTDPEKAGRILDELRRQGKKSDWELDWSQADLYYNTGKYKLANFYYERVAANEEVAGNSKLYINLLSILQESYMLNNNLQGTMDTAMKLLSLAKENEDLAEAGRAYMFIGNVMFYRKNYDIASQYHQLAEKNLKLAENDAYLLNLYMTLANMHIEVKNYPEALDNAEQAEKCLNELKLSEDEMPEQYYEYERGRLYTLTSYILSKLGKTREAKEYYDKFMQSPCAKDSRVRIHIVPYLINTGNYGDALYITLERESQLRNNTDTIGTDMLSVKKHLAKIYFRTSNFSKAYSYLMQAEAIKDSIRMRERNNDATAQAMILQVAEKEAKLTEQQNQLYLQRIMLISTIIIAVLMTVIVFAGYRAFKELSKKNKGIALLLREMQHYKALYYKLLNEKASEYKEAGEEEVHNNMLDERQTYELLCRIMEKDKLFLDPNLTRDSIIELLSVKRNVFINSIRDYYGGSFTEYINQLRLEEAIRLMNNNDFRLLTMEEISEQAGFGSVRSFYRQFKLKYGMSPSEFRQYNSDNNPKRKENTVEDE